MKTFVCAIILFACGALQASLLAELSASAKAEPSCAMEILQEKRMSFFGETAVSKMRLAVSENGAMRMQTYSPFEALTVCDGADFARFERDGGRWRKLDAASGAMARTVFGQIMALFTGGVSASAYSVSESGDVVSLVPQNESVRRAVAKIELFTAKRESRRMVEKIVITDADGDTTALKILSWRRLVPRAGMFSTQNPSEWTPQQ